MITDDLDNSIAALLNKHSGRDDTLKNALAKVLADFESETGAIHLLDAGRQVLHLAAEVGLPAQMLEIVNTIPVGKGIAGQTVAQNQPVAICHLQTDSSGIARPRARESGVGGAVCVPLRRRGQIVGTLGIGTRREHQYTPEEIARLEAAADDLGARLQA